MNEYTIYCTQKQTNKALEFGAPIILFCKDYIYGHINYMGSPIPIGCVWINNDLYYAPTAEQMISWLEDQEEISDLHIYKIIQSWTFELYASNGDGKNEHPLFQSRKEATIAAIDAALEYLSNNKK